MPDRRDDTLRRHRALAEPSRARILAELGGGKPLDARELAARVGLHVNTVRVHLAALADAGLVTGSTVPPQGPGRPRLVYRATAAGTDERRRYRLLAEILTALVARFGPGAGDQLEAIGHTSGRQLVGSSPAGVSLTEAEAVGRLIELLDDIGFEPELEPGTRSQRILMRPCPFLELARQHPEVVCRLHLSLMRGALAELGATTSATKLTPFVQADLCVAHLAAAPR